MTRGLTVFFRKQHWIKLLFAYKETTPGIKELSPLVMDDFIQHGDQLFRRNVMDTQFLCDPAGHHAVHVLTLIPKQRKHQHGHAVADPFVDAVGTSMSHEDFSFGMGCGAQQMGPLQAPVAGTSVRICFECCSWWDLCRGTMWVCADKRTQEVILRQPLQQADVLGHRHRWISSVSPKNLQHKHPGLNSGSFLHNKVRVWCFYRGARPGTKSCGPGRLGLQCKNLQLMCECLPCLCG